MQTEVDASKRVEVAATSGVILTPDQSLNLARGFSWAFWGLPLTLLLFFDALQVQMLVRLRFPSYVVGVVILFSGLVYMNRVGDLTRSWRGLARIGLALSFLMIYLAPFVYWWQRAPHVRFFSINVWVLLASTMLILVTVNRLAAELGVALQDDTFAMEARLCAWSVVVLMILPFGIAISYAYYSFHKYGVSVQTTLGIAHEEMPFWLHIFFLLPFTLTMTTIWKAKERSLKGLAQSSQG